MSVRLFIDKLRNCKSEDSGLFSEEGNISGAHLALQIEERAKYWGDQSVCSKIVSICLTNSISSIVDLFSLALAGNIIYPYYKNQTLQQGKIYPFIEVMIHSQEIESKKAISDKLLQQSLLEKKPGVILSTSGTTGSAKWLLHSLDGLIEKYAGLKKNYKLPLIYALDNVSGLETLISILMAGGQVFWGSDIPPYSLSSILYSHDFSPTLLSCTPSYLKLMLLSAEKSCFGDVLQVNLGGERLLEKDRGLFQNALPRARINSFYGTSETSSIRTRTKSGTNQINWGVEGEDFKVEKDILFLRKKDFHMLGYLFAEADSDPDWYRTNDLVKSAGNGYYTIEGRADRVAIVAGKRVLLDAVENTIRQMEGIESCYVFSEENALIGNMLCAEVTCATDKITVGEVRKFCIEKLDENQRPMKITKTEQIKINSRLKRG